MILCFSGDTERKRVELRYPDYSTIVTTYPRGTVVRMGTPLTFDQRDGERSSRLVTGTTSPSGAECGPGRLITPNDDTEPGSNPVAVLSTGSGSWPSRASNMNDKR